MGHKYKNDLDKVRVYFHLKKQDGVDKKKLYSETLESLYAKDSKKVFESMVKDQNNKLVNTRKSWEKGVSKLMANAHIGSDMPKEVRDFGVRQEVESMIQGTISPTIAAKDKIIDQLAEKEVILENENQKLNTELESAKKDYSKVNGRLNNLVSNLIGIEKFSESKIKGYSNEPFNAKKAEKEMVGKLQRDRDHLAKLNDRAKVVVIDGKRLDSPEKVNEAVKEKLDKLKEVRFIVPQSIGKIASFDVKVDANNKIFVESPLTGHKYAGQSSTLAKEGKGFDAYIKESIDKIPSLIDKYQEKSKEKGLGKDISKGIEEASNALGI